MSLEKIKHYPVMLKQILSILSPQHGGTFIDCTFGGGGYSKEILKYPNTNVIALDRDKLAHNHAKNLIKKYPTRFRFFQEKFSNLNKIIDQNTNPKAIIFDLGLSSLQLLDEKRGFSFESKNFLNMEMGLNKNSVYNVINTLEKNYLATIIKVLGDEKDGRRIAHEICKYRKKRLIKTSNELASIIINAKKKYKNKKRNPATKTFQALRIFVNQELTELVSGLIEASKIISKDGAIIVVSFHSLEDRVVKSFFNLCSDLRKNPSRYLPSIKLKNNLFKIISKKPLVPESKEIEENARSRSAKLRYAIRSDSSFLYPMEFKNKFSSYIELESRTI